MQICVHVCKLYQRPTASSAWPWNTIFWPCCIPFSTWTSNTFFSWTTLFPLQLGHLSLSLMISPEHWTTLRTNSVEQYFQMKDKRAAHLILCIQGKQCSSVGSCQGLSALWLFSFQHHDNHGKFLTPHSLILSWRYNRQGTVRSIQMISKAKAIGHIWSQWSNCN